MTLPEHIENEREWINRLKVQALAEGDLLTFNRLEGRLEQLVALEAWCAASETEPRVRIAH